MTTISDTPLPFGIAPVVEGPPDLVDLLTATKVINREILNKQLSFSAIMSVRFVTNELLDVALEIVAGDDDNQLNLFSHPIDDDIPY